MVKLLMTALLLAGVAFASPARADDGPTLTPTGPNCAQTATVGSTVICPPSPHHHITHHAIPIPRGRQVR